MEAGKLRHRITIERRVESQNAYGETVVQWAPFPAVHASFVCPSGRDYILQDRPGNIIERIYAIRHNPAVAAGMRVNHDSNIYYIAAVLPDPTDAKQMKLMTRSAENG